MERHATAVRVFFFFLVNDVTQAETCTFLHHPMIYIRGGFAYDMIDTLLCVANEGIFSSHR